MAMRELNGTSRMHGVPNAVCHPGKVAVKCVSCAGNPPDLSARHPVHADIRLPDISDPGFLSEHEDKSDILSFHARCLKQPCNVGDCITF
jgi:hypothetical protein